MNRTPAELHPSPNLLETLAAAPHRRSNPLTGEWVMGAGNTHPNAQVVSRRPVPHLSTLGDRERDGLADMLKRLTNQYDALFDVSFPYSAGIHQAPPDSREHPEWHLRDAAAPRTPEAR